MLCCRLRNSLDTMGNNFRAMNSYIFIILLCVIEYISNGCSRYNIMELIEEQSLPNVVKFLFWIMPCSSILSIHHGNGGENLGSIDKIFALAVLFFKERLCRIGASMCFKVQLVIPGWKVGRLFFQLLEKFLSC